MSADLWAAFGDQSHPTETPSTTTKLGTSSNGNSQNEVLFDATAESIHGDNSGDDEWGEFESADQPLSAGGTSVSLPQQQRSILETHEKATNALVPTLTPCRDEVQPKSNSPQLVDFFATDDELHNDVLHGSITSKHREQQQRHISTSVVPPVHENKDDEEWGDFIDGFDSTDSNIKSKSHLKSVPEPTATHGAPPKSYSLISEQTTKSKAKAARQSSDPQQVRPTNIPPPSILLPLFPPLLEELQQTAAVSIKRKNGNPPDNEFVDNLTCNLKVLAHVSAGRQLRWKRDHILSQSTKIGPARSGKSGGMKLSSVNKGENIKEEKEAVEALDAWKKYNGLFNSVISAAARPPIPLSANMQVKIANADEGALKATHACALCGLKRDERIPKVDEDVNDSFGEWWFEYWGHTDCKSFWEINATRLDHR